MVVYSLSFTSNLLLFLHNFTTLAVGEGARRTWRGTTATVASLAPSASMLRTPRVAGNAIAQVHFLDLLNIKIVGDSVLP